MRLLDLFCGAGGAAMGYHRAGFTDIVGIDNRPQPRYPFKFIQGDALEYLAEHGHEFDVIHASPPCQLWSEATPPGRRQYHSDMITPTRRLLDELQKPYVIENVEGARHMLINPVKLCGTMFGLNIWRHRYFELRPRWAWLTPGCQHNGRPVLLTGQGHARPDGTRPRRNTMAEKSEAGGIDWMTGAELTEAIPPAYTEWLGRQLMTDWRMT
jgi:DNA (cytosine-5)-methyltransferase 1